MQKGYIGSVILVTFHTTALDEPKCRLKMAPLLSPLPSFPLPLSPLLQATLPPQQHHAARQLGDVLREEGLEDKTKP